MEDEISVVRAVAGNRCGLAAAPGTGGFSLSTMANWDLGFYFTSYDAIASREVKPRLVTWYRHGVSSKSPERAPQDSK